MKKYSARGLKRARQLRRTWTDTELRLWPLLRNRSADQHKFRRQHPVGPYVVDFVCLERRLIVEVDGSQHADRIEHDASRTAYLEAQGFHVLRFWDNDVLLQTDAVMQVIFDMLTGPSP
jgi:adenine-specific DNA-methyltransferase